MLQGVRTPERPSSPAELYVTEEQTFLRQNPKVVLSLPKHESAQEQSLAQINALILQLSESSHLKQHQLTAGTIGQQLWRELLNKMAGEAMWLRDLLGLPERDTWIDEKEESPISNADMANTKDEKSEKKGVAAAKEEKSGVKSNKGESKSATTEKSVKDIKKKGKRREEVGKRTKEKQGKESDSLTETASQSISEEGLDDPHVETHEIDNYKRLLHTKVYALMEDLVDNLCDRMDDLNEGDEPDTITTRDRQRSPLNT
ncbi:hypothetical protein PBY51_020483 [Eleginops maclovinus]|uniref:Uncharacterized protein n=1 Tax=Eleginops maclovinus TaxID=56733 RepID=A0AAN8ANA6_ELEMC|nr:hypothetical protein PBY51_020483 [Eleginops maclovinus]